MATSAYVPPPMCQDNAINRKPREKRAHHHHIPHIRPMQKPNDRKPKLRAKQRPNNYLLSTDGTTSGDDGSETKNKQEVEMSEKLDQMLRPSNQLASDLEADCEDNNYTDVDTVSVTSNKNESNTGDLSKQSDSAVQVLHTKIVELEKQLATVLQKNMKLTEENNKLKKMAISK